MNLLKNLGKIVAAIALAVLATFPAFAYSTVYPMDFGTPRMGAYTSAYTPDMGLYNYMSPPIALTRYGYDYHITNIRSAVYPNYPFTYMPSINRPYIGYPYGIDRTPNVRYRSTNGMGGFY